MSATTTPFRSWRREPGRVPHDLFSPHQLLSRILHRSTRRSLAASLSAGLGSCIVGLAAVYGVGQDAENFKHQGAADDCGIAARIKGRRHLDDVTADQIEALQAADHALRLGRGEASYLRRARAGGIGGIEPVNIEADVG